MGGESEVSCHVNDLQFGTRSFWLRAKWDKVLTELVKGLMYKASPHTESNSRELQRAQIHTFRRGPGTWLIACVSLNLCKPGAAHEEDSTVLSITSR